MLSYWAKHQYEKNKHLLHRELEAKRWCYTIYCRGSPFYVKGETAKWARECAKRFWPIYLSHVTSRMRFPMKIYRVKIHVQDPEEISPNLHAIPYIELEVKGANIPEAQTNAFNIVKDWGFEEMFIDIWSIEEVVLEEE